jgi:hypothetical protein
MRAKEDAMTLEGIAEHSFAQAPFIADFPVTHVSSYQIFHAIQ